MSVELYNKIHELELRCKELKTERDSTKEAHRILNNWRNDNLSKINNYDSLKEKLDDYWQLPHSDNPEIIKLDILQLVKESS